MGLKGPRSPLSYRRLRRGADKLSRHQLLLLEERMQLPDNRLSLFNVVRNVPTLGFEPRLSGF